MLSPEQEQFLNEFYALCERYRSAGVVAYSQGLHESGYLVTLLLQTSHKKDLDGAGLVEFDWKVPSSLGEPRRVLGQRRTDLN